MIEPIDILSELGFDFYADREWNDFECPFCHHHNQKFGLSRDHGGYNCYHCERSGSLRDLLRKVCGWSTNEAAAMAAYAGVSTTTPSRKAREPLPELNLQPIMKDGKPANKCCAYLTQRGFSLAEIERLLNRVEMFYVHEDWPEDPDNPDTPPPKLWDHLVWPVYDSSGGLVEYEAKRPVDGKAPKSLGGKDYLWNGYSACRHNGDMLFVTEGVLDAMRVMLAIDNLRGVRNVVAFRGTGNDRQYEQLKTLAKGYAKVYLLLDNDDAGHKAAAKLTKAVPNAVNASRWLPEDPAALSTDECRTLISCELH